jgi:hypothetical protein
MKRTILASLTAVLLLPIHASGYYIDTADTEQFEHWQIVNAERANYTGTYDHYIQDARNSAGDIYGSFSVAADASDSSNGSVAVAITHTFIDEGVRIVDSDNFSDINYTYDAPDLPSPLTQVVSAQVGETIDYMWDYTAWGDFRRTFDLAFVSATPDNPDAYSFATLWASYRIVTTISLYTPPDGKPVPNPEPATFLLFGLGAAGILGKKRLSKR